MTIEYTSIDAFPHRPIGSTPQERSMMLECLGYASASDLLSKAVPSGIRTLGGLDLVGPLSETDALRALRSFADQNTVATTMIGQGYHATSTPGVIRRNVLEDPSWYTAYTPYQPEISQGRLEALINFQTMVADLTGLPTANASLLDEGTAIAEAIGMMLRATRSDVRRILVDDDIFGHTAALLDTRAEALGIELMTVDISEPLPDVEYVGVVVFYLGASGRLVDPAQRIAEAHAVGALTTVVADLLALTIVTPPGEFGADIAVGSTQRFGVPMFYGGPHAAFVSTTDTLQRHLPGRLVGVSKDANGAVAYRLALQTREQHIRRDRATSNICTAQVLLAVVASMYLVYHGPAGLAQIAERVHRHACGVGRGWQDSGWTIRSHQFFDTVMVDAGRHRDQILERASALGLRLGSVGDSEITVACSELTTGADVHAVLQAFGTTDEPAVQQPETAEIPADLRRGTQLLTHPVFDTHHSETAMLRYLRSLSDKDFALDRGMIPLGSCTMKLNTTTEMEPVSWPEFADLHPFAPASDAAGYHELIAQLEHWLAEITGYHAVSIQPNAGSQGELADLLAIRAHHRANGESERTVCLIPSSAHGTNAASAVLAGLRVVVVAFREDGSVDLADLEAKADAHADQLAAIIVTYPSTSGMYESGIEDICDLVHKRGGQVYVDGANLNALVGVAKPGAFGGDVSHLNLHKTFCILHGGGGPGVGPVAVAEHLAPYLPSHPLHPLEGRRAGIGPISAAPYGSAGILMIPWAYIAMMGPVGLVEATESAVIYANYIAHRLAPHFPILYMGTDGLVAHECIVDLRPITAASGVTVDGVAKRLIDFGFHPPTMSFPVAGTLMIEPTESESVVELDRFCDAMIAIRAEIASVEDGSISVVDSPLRGAPHAAECLTDEWDRAYSRRQAVYPSGVATNKYWPPVRRIDQAYGDRNLFCSCPPIDTEG